MMIVVYSIKGQYIMFDYRDSNDIERDAEHAALVAEHADIVVRKSIANGRMNDIVPLSSYGNDCKQK